MSPQYGELRLTATEIGPVVWGTPANFNGFRVLASLLQRRRSKEANQALHNVWLVEPAALHAAAKNIIYFTALAVLRGRPHSA